MLYQRRCEDLARLGHHNVRVNPAVGAVVVHCRKIIAEGFHRGFGLNHAEIDALEKLDNQVDTGRMEMYVSLEPCSHYGKTPPCAKVLVERGLQRCHVTSVDPNPVVNGRGIEILKAGDVEVELRVPELANPPQVRPFEIQQLHQRPYIILKWAQSNDGYLAKSDGRSKISNPYTDRLVHKWRRECDAILVGRQTVMIDRPLLTNRLYFGKSPLRVTIDSSLKIPQDHSWYHSSMPTLTYNQRMSHCKGNNSWVKFDDPGNLRTIVKDMYQRQVGTLLVEGGATIHESFLQVGLWDEIRLIQSTTVSLGGGVKAPVLDLTGSVKTNCADDQIYVLYNQHSNC